MTRALKAWERFWFAPQPTSTLAIFRIAFGLVALAWTLALAPDLLTFYSRDGVVPRQPEFGSLRALWTWGLLSGAPGDAVVVGTRFASRTSSTWRCRPRSRAQRS